MTKHEFPPFNMVIENGRLVPATPYDAERLDSFRRGTKVRVRFTEEKDRILVRKWWAILGLVVKQCPVPWKTKEEASEAVKLALGIVNLTKTVKGDFLAYPKSLTDLEDPELQEAVDNMTELLSRLTGVDVETLKKETAHIQPETDEPHDPDTGEPSPNEASDAAPSLAGSDEGGAAPSPAEALPEEPAGESVSAPAGSAIPDKEIEVLKRFAKSVLSLASKPDTSGETMTKVVNRWINIDLVNVQSDEGRAAVKSIHGSVKAIMAGNASYDAAVELHSEGLGCEPAELMPEVKGNG